MTDSYSYVYFMQSGESGPIKIGTTRFIDERMSSLQVGCPGDLKLIGWCPGNQRVEG